MPGAYGHLYSRIQELKGAKNIDILFLGSSHTYRSFDTRIFDSAGLKSFNLGSSSQTPIETHLLVNKYLTNINPAIVMYEVNPVTFANDGVESSLDLISNDNISIATVKMAVDIKNIKTFNTLIYGIYRQAFKLDKNFQENPVKDKDKYIKGGFVEREMEYFHHKKYNAEKVEIKKDQLRSFDETLKYVHRKGIKIILVQSPITSGLYNSYTNNDKFDSIIKSRKFAYLNFNKLLNLDDSLHFYDSHHLNQEGVKIFNSKLIQIIKSNYIDKK